MAYEKHKKGSHAAKSKKEPKISIWSSDLLGVNAAAVEEFFGDTEWVELYYDPERDRVGIKPLEEETEDAYHLRKREEGKSGRINAKSFLAANNLQTDEAEQYEADWDEEHDLVYIEVT